MIKESKSNRTRQVQFRMDPDKVKRLLAAIAYDDNMHSMTEFISKIKCRSVSALKNLQTLDKVLGCS